MYHTVPIVISLEMYLQNKSINTKYNAFYSAGYILFATRTFSTIDESET